MRWTRLAILGLVVVALGAYIWFVERHAPTTDELKESSKKVFPTFDQAKVRRLLITNSHGRFELVKENDDWKLKTPIADDANAGAVTSLFGSLAALTSERTLDVKDVKLADFGLETPALKLTAVTDDGVPFELSLGAEMPLQTTRAALTTGSTVFLVNKYIASDLDKDTASWRSDQLLKVSSADVAALNVTYSGVRLALAHTGNGWTLTEPVADLANRERVEGLLADLGAAKIKEFVDTPGPLTEYGLEPRAVDVTVIRKGDGAVPVVIELGIQREVAGARQIACRRGERVFWVEASAAAKLTGEPSEWRAGKLVQLDTWSADSLEISAGPAKAALQRKDGVWRAGDVEVDFTAVSSRLNTLANLAVTAFDQPKPAGTPLGTVKVSVAAGTVEASFFAGGTPALSLAVVPGRPGALAVDRATVDDLLADPAALTRPRPTPPPAASPAAGATPSATP